jgi:phosphoribosyl 1,2-cyclic phosphate phosphodiesterase
MFIRILGTAAAEGWPAVFCGCQTCRRARAAGGKDLRSRASVQIDDVFRIDLPPDTYSQAARFGLDLSVLKHLFFTHSHADHFALRELAYLAPPFAHDLANAPVKIYGNETVVGAIENTYSAVELPIELHRVEAFVPVQADYLTFTPVRAQHKPDEVALNYVVQSDSATVLYASDTGLYDQATMEELARFRFDLLIIECTQGTLDMPSTQHMGFSGVLELRRGLIGSGAARPDTRTVITHFSHNIGMLHAEMEAVAAKEGIEVAYDGWSAEL